MLRSPPPFGECFCQSKMKRDNFGRTHSLAPHRPSPVTSAVGLPGGLPCPRSDPPCVWTPSGRQCDLALHGAWPCILASVTTRGRLDAQPRIARPTLPRLAFQPHSLSTFFPSPPFVVANLAFFSSILPFFLFLFLVQREEQRGGGVLESFRVMSWCSGYGRPAAGTVRCGSPVSLSGPRVSCWLSPRASP